MEKTIIVLGGVILMIILGFVALNTIHISSKPPAQTLQSPSTKIVNTTPTEVSPTPVDQNAPFASPITKTSQENSYTLVEVSKHAIEADCWFAIDENVYDVTTFIPNHPGGQQILAGCGKNASAMFNERHSDQARAVLPDYLIGKLGK